MVLFSLFLPFGSYFMGIRWFPIRGMAHTDTAYSWSGYGRPGGTLRLGWFRLGSGWEEGGGKVGAGWEWGRSGVGVEWERGGSGAGAGRGRGEWLGRRTAATSTIAIYKNNNH